MKRRRRPGVVENMRTTIARVLFLALVTQACTPSRDSGTSIDLSALETRSTAMSNEGAAEHAAPEFSSGLDTAEVYGGTGMAMALDEGKLGKTDDPGLARQQAIAHARTAGVLGSATIGRKGLGGPGPAAHYRLDDDGTVRGPHGVITDGEPAERPVANAWTTAALDRVSTFAADVDTAAYSLGRRYLTDGQLPMPASVRVEEYVNYFTYGYAPPPRDQPFAVAMDLAPSPFDATHQVLRVGVSTRALARAERKLAHLVFLVDVSGSMRGPDRLELAKKSLRVLVDNLQDGDTVALVTYAGSTEVVLPATGLDHKAAIVAAIDGLTSGGGTAMGDGMQLAYAEAAKGLRPGAFSRVIVLSDGDANIGTTDHDAILASIAGKVKEGVTLSTIGFGVGNYQDDRMEQLANKGNGNNYYIDGIEQAKRVFRDQIAATLEVVAKDVKLQVEFDPERVARYRLIGYENRDIKDSDFRQDRVDAGEIGAGHQVTALYELELTAAASRAPIATVRIRHKAPTGTTATEAAYPMPASAIASSFATAAPDLRFAFAAAAFADVLRGSRDATTWQLSTIQTLAAGAAGTSPERRELVRLIKRAIELRPGA